MSTSTPPVDDDFSEFSSVSRDEWLRAITGNKPAEKRATNNTIHNLAFPVVNTYENLPPSEHRPSPVGTSRAVDLEVDVEETITSSAWQTLVHSGVSGGRLTGPRIADSLRALATLDHPCAVVSWATDTSSSERLAAYLNYFRSTLDHPRTVRGTIYHTTTRLEHWQSSSATTEPLALLIDEAGDLPLRVLAINGDAFHRQGASVVDELAATLSWLVAYYDELTDRGLAIDTLLAHTEITLATGSDFYLDLAKFRAIRSLVAKVAEAYGTHDPDPPLLRAVSGTYNKTLYDPDGNILRNTTEALAALLGGVDTLSLLPHDFLYPSSDTFGQRMATNVYHILRHEAHVTRVADPAAGSYFLENVTRQLVEKSWQLFLRFESRGGFRTLLDNDTLPQRWADHRAAQAQRVTTQTQVIVGANRYANPRENVGVAYDDATPRRAASFEAIRHHHDLLVAQGKPRPTVQLWMQRNAAAAGLINQRANYVKDTLAAVGIAYEEHLIQAAADFSSDPAPHSLGAVFCGTDDFYESVVTEILTEDQSADQRRWTVGGSATVEKAVRQVGGSGVWGIGRDVISLINMNTR